MTDYKDWTPRQKAEYILKALHDKNLPEDLFEQIQGWIAGGDSAEAKSEELDDMLDLMFRRHASPTRRTYQLLAEVHRRCGLPVPEVPGSKLIKLRRRTILRIAAALIPVILVTAVGLYMVGRGKDILTSPMYTSVPAASVYDEITLPDGSRVRVSPGTELQYAEGFEENRSVRLSGEAFFSVRKMEQSPFTVETDNLTVTVLGTEFNLRAYRGEDTTEVSLATGSVEVKTGDRRVILAPMEQFVLTNSRGESAIRAIGQIEVDTWKGQKLPIDNLPVVEALKKAGMFYGARIEIDENYISDKYVRTILDRNDSLEDVLNVIQRIEQNMGYSVRGDTVVISKR